MIIENILNKIKNRQHGYTTFFFVFFILVNIVLFCRAALTVQVYALCLGYDDIGTAKIEGLLNGKLITLNNTIYLSNDMLNSGVGVLLLSVPPMLIFIIYALCAVQGIVISILYYKKYHNSLCAFILFLFFSYILVLYYYYNIIAFLYHINWGV